MSFDDSWYGMRRHHGERGHWMPGEGFRPEPLPPWVPPAPPQPLVDDSSERGTGRHPVWQQRKALAVNVVQQPVPRYEHRNTDKAAERRAVRSARKYQGEAPVEIREGVSRPGPVAIAGSAEGQHEAYA
jgi:hypothetical protein